MPKQQRHWIESGEAACRGDCNPFRITACFAEWREIAQTFKFTSQEDREQCLIWFATGWQWALDKVRDTDIAC